MVVVHGAVVRRVVDVEVEEPRRVHGCEGRRDRQPLLLGRAERRRHVRPAGCRVERDAKVVDPEGIRAVGLARDVVVEQDPAPREERPEVHDGALEHRHVPARRHPLDRDDVLARALGGLAERVGLENSRRGEARRAVEARVGQAVERVVRRAVHPWPRAGRQGGPADAGVRRKALRKPIVTADTSVNERPVGGHAAVPRVLLHEVRPHAVG